MNTPIGNNDILDDLLFNDQRENDYNTNNTLYSQKDFNLEEEIDHQFNLLSKKYNINQTST